jgi:hypothetical protein
MIRWYVLLLLDSCVIIEDISHHIVRMLLGSAFVVQLLHAALGTFYLGVWSSSLRWQNLYLCKMEAICFSETLVSACKSTWHHYPKEQHWQVSFYYGSFIVAIVNLCNASLAEDFILNSWIILQITWGSEWLVCFLELSPFIYAYGCLFQLFAPEVIRWFYCHEYLLQAPLTWKYCSVLF